MCAIYVQLDNTAKCGWISGFSLLNIIFERPRKFCHMSVSRLFQKVAWFFLSLILTDVTGKVSAKVLIKFLQPPGCTIHQHLMI